MDKRSAVVGFFARAFRWLDRTRRVLHFFVLVGGLVLLLALFTPQTIIVPGSAALVLNPQGVIVEQLSGDPFERALARAQGLPLDQSLLPDLVDAVREATEDDRIKAIVLQLDGMTGAGLSKLQDLAAELEAFRESGKPVYAIGAAFDRNQYFLAAQADEILLDPMGIVLVDGYEVFIPYYREAIEKLEIDYKVWAAGEFKSAVEPVTRSDMSPQDREARLRYLTGMWDQYQETLVAARDLAPDAMQRYADEFASLLAQRDGDTAVLALEYGLVDELLTFDEIESRIREVAGSDDGERGYAAIDYASYLTSVRAENLPEGGDDKLAVIVASGEILDGEQPSGFVGSESIARLIRAATEDDDVRGLVVRVDSPGGSAFASERIRRELELFGETGRPVVVSMGSVAASGGYWISMGADEIWASPATLTGSIGAFFAVPTFPRTLARLGVNIDGVGTTRLAGQMNLLNGIGEDIDAYVALALTHTYEDFVGKVAAHRELEPASVEAAAQGRVWIGTDAMDRGLVDALGSLDDALDATARLAGLEEDAYSIEYIESQPGFAERVAMELVRVASPVLSAVSLPSLVPERLRAFLAELDFPLPAGARLNDPRGIYSHCLCDVR